MKTKSRVQKGSSRDAKYRALAKFRYHIRKYLDFSDQAAKSAGLEPRQYQLLLAVRGLPPDLAPTVTALAEQLRTRHHSTVELVNRAERNGLVRRYRNGSYVLVLLTAKGERVLEKAVDQRLRELRVAGPLLVKSLQELIADESGRLTATEVLNGSTGRIIKSHQILNKPPKTRTK